MRIKKKSWIKSFAVYFYALVKNMKKNLCCTFLLSSLFLKDHDKINFYIY